MELTPENLSELAAQVSDCVTIDIDHEFNTIQIRTTVKEDSYAEWIKGEGADICLYRSFDDDSITGCTLQMRAKRLALNVGWEDA